LRAVHNRHRAEGAHEAIDMTKQIDNQGTSKGGKKHGTLKPIYTLPGYKKAQT